MEFIAAAQDETYKKHDLESVGCPWGIASAEYGYCFWRWMAARSDADGRMEPVPDKEICALLCISQYQLESILASALAKARNNRDAPEWRAFRETVLDVAATAPDDNTVYLPDNFRVDIPAEDENAKDEELPPEAELVAKPRRRINSQPLHRSGKRTDLFGLYSRKTTGKKR